MGDGDLVNNVVAVANFCLECGPIGVGAQSTLAGGGIFGRNYVWQINKMLEFYMIFSREINNIPTFYTTFAQNMPEFYLTLRLPEQYFLGIFFWGGGGNPLLGAGPQAPHQLNPALEWAKN